jgi:hypothetical protein
MRHSLRILAVAVLLFSQAAVAQPKGTTPAGYIEFVPVRVSLGMPKDRTIALLSEHYDVSPWKGGDVEDSWGISEKTGQHVAIGTLSFVSGVLIRAGRFWNVEDSSYALAHTMSLLISHLHDEGFTHCTISTRQEPSPNVETEVLGINCGQKGVVVQADRRKDAQGVQVIEDLEASFTPSH